MVQLSFVLLHLLLVRHCEMFVLVCGFYPRRKWSDPGVQHLAPQRLLGCGTRCSSLSLAVPDDGEWFRLCVPSTEAGAPTDDS